MQLLCHLGRQKRRFAGVASLLALWLMGWATVWAAAPVPAGTTLQDKLLAEVAQWVQQTQQLTPDQFGFVPIDARVQVQSCDRALAMARKLADGPTFALGVAKSLIRNSFDNSWDEHSHREAEGLAACAATEDHFEGLNAFLDKRKPAFKGK